MSTAAIRRRNMEHAHFSAFVVAADVISAVEFDADGSYLATGDKGGRVVLFEKVSTQPVRGHSLIWHYQRREALVACV